MLTMIVLQLSLTLPLNISFLFDTTIVFTYLSGEEWILSSHWRGAGTTEREGGRNGGSFSGGGGSRR